MSIIVGGLNILASVMDKTSIQFNKDIEYLNNINQLDLKDIEHFTHKEQTTRISQVHMGYSLQ